MMAKVRQLLSGRSHREWLEYALLCALSVLLLWKGVAVGWAKLNTDFPNYYLVARLLRQGYSVDRIYDWIWLHRIKDYWGLDTGNVGFVGLTPFSAWAVMPLVGWSALTAKRIWLLLNLLFLGVTAEVLHQESQLGRRRVWILSLLAIVPLRSSFAYGQMHLLVLLLMVLAFRFERRNRPIASGICLGLAGALKIYPLLFAFYFVWKRRWREATAIVVCFAAIVVLGYLWMGHGAVGEFLQEILPRTMQAEIVDPYNLHPGSASALLHRLFVREPGLNPFPMIDARWLFAVLYPLWQVVVLLPLFAALRNATSPPDEDAEALDWAAFVAVLLLLSPVPASYHFVVLIAAIVPLVDVLRRRGQKLPATLAVVLYVLICMMNSPRAVPEHFSLAWITSCNRLWLQLLLWAGLMFYLWSEREVLPRLKRDRQYALLLASPFLLFWIWGLASYERHFAGWDADFARRVTVPGNPLLAGQPVPRRGGFVYTALMGDGRYNVLDQNGEPVDAVAQGDVLSAAAHGAMTIVERVDSHGSHLQEVPEQLELNAMLQKLEDAERPVFSPDGAWLAYIHEEKGRGSLWVMHLQGRQASASTLLELVSRGSDVRDAAFLPSGDVAFSATIDGKFGIYEMPPTRSHGPEPLVVGGDVTDSPAISPDGKQLAFRRRVGGRWQLMLKDLATPQQRSLTAGDCDAYSPTWLDRATILYATDCGRAVGLTALAKVRVGSLKVP